MSSYVLDSEALYGFNNIAKSHFKFPLVINIPYTRIGIGPLLNRCPNLRFGIGGLAWLCGRVFLNALYDSALWRG